LIFAGAASLGISREASGLERPHIPGLAVPAKKVVWDGEGMQVRTLLLAAVYVGTRIQNGGGDLSYFASL
jgi:hypothetical protein